MKQILFIFKLKVAYQLLLPPLAQLEEFSPPYTLVGWISEVWQAIEEVQEIVAP